MYIIIYMYCIYMHYEKIALQVAVSSPRQIMHFVNAGAQ